MSRPSTPIAEDRLSRRQGSFECFSDLKSSFDALFKDQSFIGGVWIPCWVNIMTKTSSSAIEIVDDEKSYHLLYSQIAIFSLNVAVMAVLISRILRENRTLLAKSLHLTGGAIFHTVINLLLLSDYFREKFTQKEAGLEKSTGIVFGGLYLFYIVALGVQHAIHYKQSDHGREEGLLEAPQIVSSQGNESENNSDITIPSCYEKYFIPMVDEFQLPLKFLFGVTGFFFGLLLGSKLTDQANAPKAQIPLSMSFYSIGMAMAQCLCDALRKQKPNRALVSYALGAGLIEGAIYSCSIIFLPDLLKEYSGLSAPPIIGLSTTMGLFGGGLVIRKMLQATGCVSVIEDNQEGNNESFGAHPVGTYEAC